MRAVIDTCVMIDMLMESRPRHAQALLLRRELIRLNVTATLPMFAMFEISHATRQESRLSSGNLIVPDLDDEPRGVPTEFIPVDWDFVKKYFDVNLPELRAGDLVFAALAKGEALPLITEDGEFARIAKQAGMVVLSILEYQSELAKLSVQPSI